MCAAIKTDTVATMTQLRSILSSKTIAHYAGGTAALRESVPSQQRIPPAYLAMSALLLKADMHELRRDVRFVPKPDSCSAANVPA
jgi:hypothetical protein